MDYKQKYEEAKEWIESIYLELTYEQQKQAETFFPELKESEDERIRKEIMDFVVGPTILNDGKREKYLAWLEKQGEQKPITKMSVSDELYEHIRNTCACIDDAITCNSIKDVRDYLAQAKTDAKIALDMVKQNPTDEEMKTVLQTEYEKGRADVIAEFE